MITAGYGVMYAKDVRDAKSNMSDIVFEIGLFLLPFENFFFAPSEGWAALSPILFFLYVFLNFNKVVKKIKENSLKIGLLVFFGIALTMLAYIIVGIRFSNFLSTLISIALGVINLFAFVIYYERHHSLKKIVKIVLIAYSIVIIIGIVEWVTIKSNIGWLEDLFDRLFKRNYLDNNRVQFFFTEPSFIGMHLYGVLLPLYLASKEKKVLWLIIIMAGLAIFFASSMRFAIDTAIIGGIFAIAFLVRKRKFWLAIMSVAVAGGALFVMYSTNGRFRMIVDQGVYADGSYASRFFRVESSIYGYMNDIPQTLIGYGMGNSLVPIRAGYIQARSHYKSKYLREVYQLADPEYNDESASYCFFTRVISDFGLIAFILFMWLLIKMTKGSSFEYKWEYLFVILYLYLQFESYAFYALWLFITIMYFTKKDYNKKGLVGNS